MKYQINQYNKHNLQLWLNYLVPEYQKIQSCFDSKGRIIFLKLLLIYMNDITKMLNALNSHSSTI